MNINPTNINTSFNQNGNSRAKAMAKLLNSVARESKSTDTNKIDWKSNPLAMSMSNLFEGIEEHKLLINWDTNDLAKSSTQLFSDNGNIPFPFKPSIQPDSTHSMRDAHSSGQRISGIKSDSDGNSHTRRIRFATHTEISDGSQGITKTHSDHNLVSR